MCRSSSSISSHVHVTVQGDWVRINVTNNLETQSTVIHWHGIIQGGSSHMDGVPGVTQVRAHCSLVCD